MNLKTDKVTQFLPHRDPFLFLDSIKSITFDHVPEGEKPKPKDMLGSKVIAQYTVKEDHAIFRGHFPGNPILPGVIQVEMMAQAAGFPQTVIHENLQHTEIEMALLGISNAKFRRPILPGNQLEIFVECTKVRGTIMSYEGHITCEGDLMSEASFLASIKFNDSRK